MTFDEAIEELEKNVKGKNIPADVVVYFFEKMREEYVPTIEMTQEQYDVINDFRSNFSAKDLPRVIVDGSDGSWSVLDELSGRLFKHKQVDMTDKNIELIMQAWLYPESIKVIE